MAAVFEWDSEKDEINRRKHGVSFRDAQLAFFDRHRVIAEDFAHGGLSAQATGAKVGGSMKKDDGYTDEPIGPLRIIKDFLPPPDQLILKEDGVKVTISLSKRSIDFFKAHARKSRVPYQRMIRRVLDEYAGHFTTKGRR